MGIVEVSRSIGDGRFKLCGIISVPDVLRCQLTDNDKFILVACDGLWKVFSADEASAFVSAVLEDSTIQLPEASEVGTNFESSQPASLRDVRCDEACNRIAVEAVKRGCTDNVTVMIIDIQKPQSK
jgi:integrin-linked kinase-associated serine/threonine phosphatase 2C